VYLRTHCCGILLSTIVLMASTVSARKTQLPALNSPAPGPQVGGRRAITVADTIEMTRVAGDSHYSNVPIPLAYFSPDGKRFLVVLRKGTLDNNTNEYSLLLYQTAEAFHSPKPEILAQMYSRPTPPDIFNQDAIRRLHWLDDDTIAFIGDSAEQGAQVYTFNLKTRQLERRTQHTMHVLDYRMSADRTEVLFLSEETPTTYKPDGDLSKADVQQGGTPITSQMLNDILSGWRSYEVELFAQRRGAAEVKLSADKWSKEEKNETSKPPIEVTRAEDMNTPQKLYVADPKTGQKALLLDLNPQFSQLDMAKVEAVTWKGADGQEARGGLYFPLDYVSGKRYPLVIQTHGWFPDKVFMIDGPYSSGFAAQPLAARGVVVLQAHYAKGLPEVTATSKEAPGEMASYEGAIDYLDRRGLIDRDRVGILGFSRTLYHVAYALTHSKYHFAAAVLEDGVTESYLEYLTFPGVQREGPEIYGGPPFGETQASWINNSPNFNLDKVNTPVRVMEHGRVGALAQWEWFAGLKLLHKPVDMVVLPNAIGEHLLRKPWEQLLSQQGNLDWFCFWLKGEEDPDPAKKRQYERWRELKKQSEAQAFVRGTLEN
jgi:dipeptidyl aminopeptidase/acylaminoacyl peptidase